MTEPQNDTYRWDPAGNLTSVVDSTTKTLLATTPTATCYSYDGLDRLAHAWTHPHRLLRRHLDHRPRRPVRVQPVLDVQR